ncbi:hypothetical protein JOM56_010512 [Amanita muscaria]
MPLFSIPHSPYFPPLLQLQDGVIAKTTGEMKSIEEFELTPYLTSSESSGFLSRESSPYSEPVSRPVETDMTDTSVLHCITASDFQHAQVGAIDPRLLSAPCDAIVHDSELEYLKPSTRISKAVISGLLCDTDDIEELEDFSSHESHDDDEYLPSEEERQTKKIKSTTRPRRHGSSRATKKVTCAFSPYPSPSAANQCSKHRSRNKLASTDAVVHELSRITEKKTATKRNTKWAKSRDLSCQICGSCFTRSSDLARHVHTHDPSKRVNSDVCIGLTIQQATDLKIDCSRLNKCVWNNELRIGGCGDHFSRTDALLRHVKLKKSQCLLIKAGQLIGPAR